MYTTHAHQADYWDFKIPINCVKLNEQLNYAWPTAKNKNDIDSRKFSIANELKISQDSRTFRHFNHSRRVVPLKNLRVMS